MAAPAEDTRRLLVDAATRGFAEHGIHTASLLEITRQAGQRNRGAVHYHFGSRAGVLVAVLQQHVPFLSTREAELLAAARERPDDDLESVVRTLVVPAVELAEADWRGRCYLMILAQLVQEGPAAVDPEIVEAIEASTGYESFTLLEQRMPPMADDVRAERLALVIGFILRTVADRGRAGEESASGRPQLETGPFTANLIAMVVGMLTAPTAPA